MKFFAAWMYIGLLGAFLFILIQLVLIIDFVHGLAESWVDHYEQTESRQCYAGALTMVYLFNIYIHNRKATVHIWMLRTCNSWHRSTVRILWGLWLRATSILHLVQSDIVLHYQRVERSTEGTRAHAAQWSIAIVVHHTLYGLLDVVGTFEQSWYVLD